MNTAAPSTSTPDIPGTWYILWYVRSAVLQQEYWHIRHQVPVVILTINITKGQSPEATMDPKIKVLPHQVYRPSLTRVTKSTSYQKLPFGNSC